MVAPAVSQKIAGKYELREKLGQGGAGSVWRAYSESLGTECALKMLLPDHLLGRDERQKLRLFREGRILAKLHSPYVVTVYDVGEWEGSPFIAMELLEGCSLRDWLTKHRVLSAATTVELVRQIALGLNKAHEADLVHRDLKPENIFVVQEQPLLVKILDFGIAKTTGGLGRDELRTTTGSLLGTPLYMSPEQVNASEVDYRSDLWSLAVICFECLTGRVPFTGETLLQVVLNIATAPLPVPSQVRVELPVAFDAFWERSANRDPRRRPISALALAEDLREVFADEVLAAALAESHAQAGIAAHGGGAQGVRRGLWLAAALLVSGYTAWQLWPGLRNTVKVSPQAAQDPWLVVPAQPIPTGLVPAPSIGGDSPQGQPRQPDTTAHVNKDDAVLVPIASPVAAVGIVPSASRVADAITSGSNANTHTNRTSAQPATAGARKREPQTQLNKPQGEPANGSTRARDTEQRRQAGLSTTTSATVHAEAATNESSATAIDKTTAADSKSRKNRVGF